MNKPICNSCEEAVNTVWKSLKKGTFLNTPDRTSPSHYVIMQLENDLLRIATKKGTKIKINKESFVSALHYLHANDFYYNNKCKIGSNSDPKKSGPLCKISRDLSNNVRCINYILPILEKFGEVEIDGNRPNKVSKSKAS